MPNTFTPFESDFDDSALSSKFTSPFDYEPHPLCLEAIAQLQEYLKSQEDWHHNFGLEENQEGKVIGKMFGVLVVKTILGEVGFLSAFSGKLAESNLHDGFVPPVYDALEEGSFLNVGMQELTEMNVELQSLEPSGEAAKSLKLKRKEKSVTL